MFEVYYLAGGLIQGLPDPPFYGDNNNQTQFVNIDDMLGAGIHNLCGG